MVTRDNVNIYIRKEKRKMMKTEVPIDLIPEKVRELLKEHKEEIEETWKKQEEEGGLSINLSAKLSTKEGNKICDVCISFTKEKVNDKRSFAWDERQGNFLKKKEKEKGEEGSNKEGKDKDAF